MEKSNSYENYYREDNQCEKADINITKYQNIKKLANENADGQLNLFERIKTKNITLYRVYEIEKYYTDWETNYFKSIKDYELVYLTYYSSSKKIDDLIELCLWKLLSILSKNFKFKDEIINIVKIIKSQEKIEILKKSFDKIFQKARDFLEIFNLDENLPPIIKNLAIEHINSFENELFLDEESFMLNAMIVNNENNNSITNNIYSNNHSLSELRVCKNQEINNFFEHEKFNEEFYGHDNPNEINNNLPIYNTSENRSLNSNNQLENNFNCLNGFDHHTPQYDNNQIKAFESSLDNRSQINNLSKFQCNYSYSKESSNKNPTKNDNNETNKNESFPDYFEQQKPNEFITKHKKTKFEGKGKSSCDFDESIKRFLFMYDPNNNNTNNNIKYLERPEHSIAQSFLNNKNDGSFLSQNETDTSFAQNQFGIYYQDKSLADQGLKFLQENLNSFISHLLTALTFCKYDKNRFGDLIQKFVNFDEINFIHIESLTMDFKDWFNLYGIIFRIPELTPRLKKIDLMNCELTDDHMLEMKVYLKEATLNNLNEFNLTQNLITTDGAIILIQSLLSNKSLDNIRKTFKLNMSNNIIVKNKLDNYLKYFGEIIIEQLPQEEYNFHSFRYEVGFIN